VSGICTGRYWTHLPVLQDPNQNRETLSACAKKLGINRSTLSIRLKRGWSEEHAKSTPRLTCKYDLKSPRRVEKTISDDEPLGVLGQSVREIERRRSILWARQVLAEDPRARGIPLTKGLIAIVDVDVYARIAATNWHAQWHSGTQSYYAANSGPRVHGKQSSVPMANVVIPPGPGELIDHRDHNTLDNRRANLRASTAVKNMQNRRKLCSGFSVYKGVCRLKEPGKWQAGIRYADANGSKRRHHLGIFTNEEEAARAYDAEARRVFGEYACVNFRNPVNQ